MLHFLVKNPLAKFSLSVLALCEHIFASSDHWLVTKVQYTICIHTGRQLNHACIKKVCTTQQNTTKST